MVENSIKFYLEEATMFQFHVDVRGKRSGDEDSERFYLKIKRKKNPQIPAADMIGEVRSTHLSIIILRRIRNYNSTPKSGLVAIARRLYDSPLNQAVGPRTTPTCPLSSVRWVPKSYVQPLMAGSGRSVNLGKLEGF